MHVVSFINNSRAEPVLGGDASVVVKDIHVVIVMLPTCGIKGIYKSQSYV